MGNSTEKISSGLFFGLFLITALIESGGILTFAQSKEVTTGAKPTEAAKPKQTPTPLAPFITELKGISIGMRFIKVTDKLGQPKSAGRIGLFYVFSDTESAQIRFDSQGNVKSVLWRFSGEDNNAPGPEDIFGPDVPLPAKRDGNVYKFIPYPSAGYWVSYRRIIAKRKSDTTIIMRKIYK